MSEDNKNLPSINDFLSNEDLPSVEEYMVENSLPSVKDYIEKEESNLKISENEVESLERNTEKSNNDGILVEVLRLIRDVRKDIPQIPEIKSYDEDLDRLSKEIQGIRKEIPEEKSYDTEIGSICNQIDEVKEYISNSLEKIPQVKNYDDEILSLEENLSFLKETISNTPEVRYYEEELETLRNAIESVEKSVPSWVKETNDVPDFSWYVNVRQTFNDIGENFGEVKNSIQLVSEKFEQEIDKLQEQKDVLSFEVGVDKKNFDEKISETKEKIWKELRSSSLKIWEYHKESKDDDGKLKKQILGEYSKLKQSVHEKLEVVNNKSIETDELLLGYFNDLREEISNFPEVKYYDEDIQQIKEEVGSVRENIKSSQLDIERLYKLVEIIKTSQKELKEEVDIVNEPTNKPQNIGSGQDPLTPMDQKFATLSDLANHYRTFISRVQQQLATVGGGGAGRIPDLDDVTFDAGIGTGKLLIFNGAKWVGIASTALGGGGGDADSASSLTLDVRNNNVGYALTIGTPVYQVGYNSGQDRLNVEIANADTPSTMPAKGVVSTTLENNTNGQIIVYGELEGVNTSAFEVADELYVAPGGGLTNVRPTDPTHLVQKIAVVLKKSTANGAILVYGAGRTNDVPNNISIAGSITAVDGFFSGNVSVGGTLTYQDVRHIDAIGIITAQQGIQILNNGLNISSGIITAVGAAGTVTIGAGVTALHVDGDARVIGILTVGRSSVTIDGTTNKITIGNEDVTISNSSITIGDNVTIQAGASGINSAPNVLYVAKDGSDSNNGTSIDNAKLTIKAAVGAATSGTTVKVLSGNYVEDNPITVPAFTAVVGDDLRTVKVLPTTPTSDLFHVNKACKLANMTFSGHTSPAAAVAFPTAGATNVGGGKWKGPYIQNCTSDTTTGTGIRVDGNLAVNTKSMNVDAFTQYNQGGVGVAVTNEGYAQLVSVFTICCDKAITCHAGGQADVANSNCSFGTLGLVADGKGDTQFIGTVTSNAAISQDNVTLNIGIGQTRPYDGQIAFFGELFESVETITVGSGGTGYTSTPTVTIAAPTGSSGETATAFATLEGESVASITVISSGSQYQTTPSVTISSPNVGSNGATATAVTAPIYYTINSSTPPSAGITTLTLAENLLNPVGVGTSVHFFQQSKIIASSHTFEYIGSGNTITLATPKRGGVTIQANEVTSSNGGKVIYTSTDQAGNFRIGDDLQINQNTGTISGRAFSRSLFSEMTPFILALS